ncbi:MAG: DUF6602 domain-containing protein [Methanococcaceae archaeon]
MKKQVEKKIDMRKLFMGFQESMKSELNTIRENVHHAPTKGNGTEKIWIKFLSEYLPHRYSIAKAIIVDYLGNTSDEIDVVIYDCQYTPFVYKTDGIRYIPAESVYAVFETKQEINQTFLGYTSGKIESVRKLQRTTTHVIDKGEKNPAPKLFEILGGFLCLANSWKKSISEEKSFLTYMDKVNGNAIIDIGCILNDKSFIYDKVNTTSKISFSTDNETLIFFFLKLVQMLQQLGTVRPIDLDKYISKLESH